jgi:hypothetical protein
MTDPAQLRDDGRVVLEAEGAAMCAAALEAALRSRQRNGRAPDDPLRLVASVLALAAPETAAHLPYLLATSGPDVAKAVARMAKAHAAEGVAAPAPGGSQGAPSEQSAVSGLSAREVARMLGYTVHGVRTACRRGRLAAGKDEDGAWLITRQAVEEWSNRAA